MAGEAQEVAEHRRSVVANAAETRVAEPVCEPSKEPSSVVYNAPIRTRIAVGIIIAARLAAPREALLYATCVTATQPPGSLLNSECCSLTRKRVLAQQETRCSRSHIALPLLRSSRQASPRQRQYAGKAARQTSKWRCCARIDTHITRLLREPRR